MDRISICESLLNRNKSDPFLKRLVTGDEKWITYDNVTRKRSWSKRGAPAQTVPKPRLTARKVLLCVWWDWQGIIYYELLPYGQTLNSELYCQQLDRLKAAIAQKRPALANRRSIVFHQDNARPHTSIVTRQKLRELGWEVLMHPPYSPGLHRVITICSCPWRTRLLVQNSRQERLVNIDCLNVLPIGTRASMREAS